MRDKVRAFAGMMEGKLAKHDKDRGDNGWAKDSPEALHKRLSQEVNELERALRESRRFRAAQMEARRNFRDVIPEGHFADLNSKIDVEIAREAADVANFAMMIADVCGGVGEPDPSAEAAASKRAGIQDAINVCSGPFDGTEGLDSATLAWVIAELEKRKAGTNGA